MFRVLLLRLHGSGRRLGPRRHLRQDQEQPVDFGKLESVFLLVLFFLRETASQKYSKEEGIIRKPCLRQAGDVGIRWRV